MLLAILSLTLLLMKSRNEYKYFQIYLLSKEPIGVLGFLVIAEQLVVQELQVIQVIAAFLDTQALQAPLEVIKLVL